MSSTILGDKDVNASLADNQATLGAGKDVKSMEYHRQVFQSKMKDEPYVAGLNTTPAAAAAPSAAHALPPPLPPALSAPLNPAVSKLTQEAHRCRRHLFRNKQYVSPSDNIMSPCSAKINALRNKHASKSVIPISLPSAAPKKNKGDNTPLRASHSVDDHPGPSSNTTSTNRAKPKSLFAQASAKRLQGDGVLGARSVAP